MLKSHSYFLIFVAALFLLIISPMWLSDGMFMDGIYYATISRNWAEGLGSFWKPHFTDTLGNPFYDHPPLVFFLEGLFFKAFGDHYWVERIYSFSCHVFMAFILWKTWKLVLDKKFHHYFWFALLLWLSVSKVSWSACNNLLENTLMLFTSLSLFHQLKYLKTHRKSALVFAGVLLFFGFLAKGFVAFFPLSTLFFYFIIKSDYRFKKLLIDYLLLIFATISPFILLWLFWPEAIESIQKYIEIQVLASLNQGQNVDSRFFILGRFFEECLIMIGVSVLLIALNKFWIKQKSPPEKTQRDYSLLFFAVALSGVLPILISLKQSTFYINPVFPLMALAFSILMLPKLHAILLRLNEHSKGFKIFKITSLVLLVIGLTISLSQATKVNRDKKRLADIRSIIKQLPEREVMYISTEIYREWSLYAYFYRYGHLSLDPENPEKYQYMIKQKDQHANIPDGFEIIDNSLNELDLYRRK